MYEQDPERDGQKEKEAHPQGSEVLHAAAFVRALVHAREQGDSQGSQNGQPFSERDYGNEDWGLRRGGPVIIH